MRSPLVAIDLPPGATHRCRAIAAPHWGYQAHQHDGCELLWIRAGRGRAQVGDATVPFAPGDLFLIGARVPHCFYSDGYRPMRSRTRGILLHFADHDSPLAACTAFKRVQPLLRAARRGCRLSGPGTAAVRDLLLRLIDAEDMRGLADFCDLLDRLCGCRSEALLSKAAAADTSTGMPNSVFAAIAAIEQHLREPLDLARLAALAGMSRSALCAAFRKHYDRSPMAYLAERRLARACALLAEGERRIVDIAFACGFNSLATFNRRFARAKGMAPSAWREAEAD